MTSDDGDRVAVHCASANRDASNLRLQPGAEADLGVGVVLTHEHLPVTFDVLEKQP